MWIYKSLKKITRNDNQCWVNITVGDTTPQFTMSIESKTVRIGDTQISYLVS